MSGPSAAHGPDPESDAALEALLAPRAPAERDVLRRAAQFAGRAGEAPEHARRALAVAGILAELRLDVDTLAAALLHDYADNVPASREKIAREFGPRVAALVDGVAKMEAIHGIRRDPSQRERAHAEGLRKMLLAMAEDARVVLIKLADRLHAMRTLAAAAPDVQRRIARETLDIFAPLANRLGIGQVKWELEDLAFCYLDPEAYARVSGYLAERREDRERYVAGAAERLRQVLAAEDIAAEVSGRPKHLYGIWRKMSRQGKNFGRVFDVRAVRILVPALRDCYAALGVVHGLWPHVPGEFDDYIATPKKNHYQSLHTAVIGPEGKTLEVQIRTHEMHRQAELGVAAHWRYKEGARQDARYDRKIAWLRSLLDWKDEVAGAADAAERSASEPVPERVYVLTPKGRIIDLPQGATALDFAYHVHTEIGHRCRGAKVNGHIVPLTYELKTAEQVEIIAVSAGAPSRDWLNLHLGYLRTGKARSRVQHWFRQQHHEEAVAAGRVALERELRRLAVSEVSHEQIARRLGFGDAEQFLAALGRGDLKPASLLAALSDSTDAPLRPLGPSGSAREVPAAPASPGITILGVGNLLTRRARCCNPLPGDAIVGFVTRGSGVTIHRSDCHSALRHHGENRERLIQVDWGERVGATYRVDVEVVAYPRAGLLRDITALLANEKINAVAVNTSEDHPGGPARMVFTLEIPDLGALSRLLAQINHVPNVLDVRRRTH